MNSLQWLRHPKRLPVLLGSMALLCTGLTFIGTQIILRQATAHSSSNQPHLSRAYALYFQGLEKHDQGDFQGAITLWNQAIAADPNFASAYSIRGLTRRRVGDIRGALRDYTRAIELAPRSAVTYYNRGTLYIEMAQYALAIADLNQALHLMPYALSYVQRGVARSYLGDKTGALQDFNQALQMESDLAPALYERGKLYVRLKRYPAAIADLQKALELFAEAGDEANYNLVLTVLQPINQERVVPGLK